IAPNISFFIEGKTAGAKIFPLFEVRDDPSRIEPPLSEESRDSGPPPTMASIAFHNVTFSYPARPEVEVLSDVSFTINAGEKVAFVGESGSGKSTSVQLLERFYDPTAGEILINGKNILEMHVHDLRSIYGYVGQEPFLFATSIRNNLAYGLSGSQVPDEKALVDACRKAQVLDFILSLPNGFDTYCGAGGGQISGGQKQRIAIARALLKRPQVLLLDEATSALDNESEKMVQKTIDYLQEHYNITTISIAHRLSTIRNSDKIFVMKKGQVVESGTHHTLMQNEGEYCALVSAQEAALTQEASQDGVHGGAVGLHPSDRRVTPELLRENSSAGNSEVPLNPTGMQFYLGEDEVAIEKARKKQVAKSYKVPYLRLLQFSYNERYYYIPACIGAAGKGLSMPLHALIVSGVIDAFYFPDKEAMMDAVEETSLKYVGLAVGVLVSCTLMHYFFSHIGEYFTYHVRKLSFAKLLEQDIGYFDDPAHAPGKLTASLSTHALKMKAITGQGLGLYVEAFAGFLGGVIISLTGVWQLGLVMTCILPLLILSWKVRSALWWTGTEVDEESLKQASQTASEAVQNIRTVRAFVAEAWTV
ncbi:(ABC) transporter, partial [Perkinsus olseni]